MNTTYRIPGAVLTERQHAVPLVHGEPSRGTISVFTREVATPDGLDRPYLVFLQGGPGFEAARPTSPPSGWMARALTDFRVLLLDQRGTGRSTPVGPVIPGATGSDQAEYLTHFRADSIVRDLQLIRAELGIDRWSLLGQSFGGFTSLTYLSLAPEGLREVLITGGLAPITNRPVDEIYAATWVRVREANQRYHDRYPGDLDRLRVLLRRLDEEDVRLPNCDRLTSRRLRQIGMWLGDSAGFERLHHLLELPFGSAAFMVDVQMASAWERNPIYATLHESSYADGGATRWSAHRLARSGSDRVCRRCLRGAIICGGDSPRRSWAAGLGHQRVRPQRLAGRWRAHPESPARHGSWSGMIRGARPSQSNEAAAKGVNGGVQTLVLRADSP
jgi:pimeloyl-ACP methyl ester carboxylesterase